MTSRLTIKKLNEEINILRQKVEELDVLKKKVNDLETALEGIKRQNKNSAEPRNDLDNGERCRKKKDKTVKCKFCNQIFSKNNELEVHLKAEHKEVKKFQCEECNLTFVLKWRLEKHLNMHKENASNLRYCHYYNNRLTCPYSDIGCMFRHEESPLCHFKDKCSKKLCQFQHFQQVDKNQNTCEKCDKMFDSDEGLKTHINEFHTEKSAEKIEMEESFELYVKASLPKMFEHYLASNNHVTCYFCDYKSKSQILKNISEEVSDHVEETHEEISATFDPDNYTFKNDMHQQFLEFVGIVPENV